MVHVHCYLTGVQCQLDEAFVLNRREAGDLLAMLKDRVASLRRVIEQLSPLDDKDSTEVLPARHQAKFTRKKHRLVCKAVAEALAPGFPEIELFQGWPAYQAHVRSMTLHDLRAQPLLAGAIKGLDDQALLQVGKKGKHLLRLLDGERALPTKTRQAIAACFGLHHRDRSAEEVDRLIRNAAAANGNPGTLGLASVHLNLVRKLLGIEKTPLPPEQPATLALSNDEDQAKS